MKNIGHIIKRLRKDMTQAELAKKAGLNFTTISKIEKGSLTGTIRTHRKIAKALEISISDLYKELDEPTAPLFDISTSNRKPVDIFYYNDKSIAQILVKQASKHKMLPELLRLEQGGMTNLEQKPRGTEQFLFVLDGAVDINIGDKKHKLIKGESLYCDASCPHTLKNPSLKTAKVLRVTTPAAL